MTSTFTVSSLGDTDPRPKTPEQKALLEEWKSVSDLNTALFRFYGRIDELGLPHLDLQFEVQAELKSPVWLKLHAFCRAYGWQLEIIDEVGEDEFRVEAFCNVQGWRKDVVASRIEQMQELLQNQTELWEALVEVW